MRRLINSFKKLKKCPYLIAIVASVAVISVYGLLLKFDIISSVNPRDDTMDTAIPVAEGIHNIKAFFMPQMDLEPVKFVPPEESSPPAPSQNKGSSDKASKKEQESVADADTSSEDEEEHEDENEDSENEADEEEEVREVETEDGSYSPYGEFTEVGDEYFDEGTVFIGDSRTKGFVLYSGLEKLSSYAESGYSVYGIYTKKIAKTPIGSFTLDQMMAAETGKYNKIYLKFGLNELGYGNDELFEQNYYSLIDMIKYYQPNAVIYVQGIMPVTKEKAHASKAYDNDRIAVRNEQLRRIAENEHVCYLNIGSVFADEEGYLPSDYAADGIHLKAPYISIWKDYLEAHAIPVEPIEHPEPESEPETPEGTEVLENPEEQEVQENPEEQESQEVEEEHEDEDED